MLSELKHCSNVAAQLAEQLALCIFMLWCLYGSCVLCMGAAKAELLER